MYSRDLNSLWNDETVAVLGELWKSRTSYFPKVGQSVLELPWLETWNSLNPPWTETNSIQAGLGSERRGGRAQDPHPCHHHLHCCSDQF